MKNVSCGQQSQMVMHLDGDSFFASCELLRRRDLWGKPLVVGEDRGIATAMNAEAKKIGIERGEPIFSIRKRFGNKVTIVPSHFELYHHIASATYNILLRFSPVVEAYSIDECFLDFSHVPDDELESRAKIIQDTLLAALGIWYSCGVARTKALAKIASKRNKPRGICVIRAADEAYYLESTPIANVWGIGWRLAPKMEKVRAHNARAFTELQLKDHLSLNNKYLRELQAELRGTQCYVLNKGRPYQKSVETTRAFGGTSRDKKFILSEFSKNIEIVCDRLVQLGVVGSHASFFIRTGMNHSRAYGTSPLGFYTDNALEVSEVLLPLFEKLLVHMESCKGTGISVHGCIKKVTRNKTLFDLPSDASFEKYRQSDIQPALKKIRDEHGKRGVMLASSMQAQSFRTSVRKSYDQKDMYIYGLPLPFLGEVK